MSSSIDRLSDDVICHILSFLPTKTSASTSVLARRWRFLWAHVPNLYFKGDDFEDESQASDIIHRVMALHRAKTINTFRIFDDVVCNGYQLATWISHAVNRGVRNLYLDFINPGYVVESFTPPRCLLTCNTLVDLKLRCCRGIISSGGNVFWPSLKKLHLSRIVYENDDCLPRLLSGCPVLEDLIVEGCYKHNPNDDYDYDDYDDDADDLGCVFVSSPTIKTLNVDLWEGCGVLKMNAPSLVYLKVNNCFLEDIASLVTMTSLIEAHFSLIGDWVEDIDDPEYSEKFINCLCNLKCLKISIDDVEKLVNIAGLRSTLYFNNLTRLELHLVFHFHELVMFLEVADNLEHLTFTLGGRHYTYKEPRLVPMCMLSRLKTVRINPFFGFNVHDFEAISYVFWNAQVLEWMEIHSDSYCSIHTEELVLLIRIPLLERGSALCRLAFY